MFENQKPSRWDEKYKMEYKITTTEHGFGKEGVVSEGHVGGWHVIDLLTKLLREIRERNNKNVEKIGAVEELLHLFNLTWTPGKTVKEWMEDFNKVDTVSYATKKFLEAVKKHPELSNLSEKKLALIAKDWGIESCKYVVDDE